MTDGTVLIVEDEKELAEVLEYNLGRSGFTTLVAHDGLAACRLAGAERPDLILLDLLLPDLDGWEICKLIRGHHDPAMATTPILMLTALGSPEDRLKGLELGADAYVAKPYSVREVVVRARQLIGRRRRETALAAEAAALRAQAALQADLQEMLCHELRNQLVIIGGFSSLLARGGAELEAERAHGYAQSIGRSSAYLSTLAETVLLARRLEGESLALPAEELDLAGVLREVVELCRFAAEAKGAAIAVKGGPGIPAVRLNAAAARVVITNLLENAIKFAGPRPQVHLRLRAPAGEYVELEVEDSGPGIPAPELERVFEKFYRGRDQAGRTPGSGLGLYLVRTLTGAMGGTIELFSPPGAGARFVLRFRRADAVPGAS